MKHPKTETRLKPLFARLLLACVALGSVVPANAQEVEEFALTTKPGVLYDGGSGSLGGSLNGIPYQIIQGYAIAQGDMVLGKLSSSGRLEIPVQTRGLGQAGALERWPDGIVPFQFGSEVTQIQRDRALEAIAHWNKRTTIKLVSRTSENSEQYKDYINFESSNGCASWVGRTGGEQAVWLADSCTVGSIIHESGHAIGLFHEHTRPDRDNFVTVNLNNVTDGKELNFEIIDVGADTFSEYDYGSIMHYGEFFFSRNGDASISVPDGVIVGQRDALSPMDAQSVDEMYATDLHLGVSTSDRDGNVQLDFTVSDSSFSVIVQPNDNTIDDLKVRVESRTLDKELGNNVYNDVIPPKNSSDEPSETVENTPSQLTPEPTVVATNGTPASIPNQGAAKVGEESSGGGGATGKLLVLSILGLLIHRRRKI